MIFKTKKAKLIAILIAAVSLLLSVVIVLLSVSSCSSDPTVVKMVKKVVKKKVIIVQEPEVESGDSNTDSDFDDDFYSDFNNWTDNENIDVNTDSENNTNSDGNTINDNKNDNNDSNSNNTTTDDNNDVNSNNSSTDDNDNSNIDTDSSTNTGPSDDTGPQYEVELKGEIKTRLSDKIAFGFWNYTWGDWDNLHGDKFGKETEIITHGNVGNIESAKWCKENGVSGWLMCGPTEGSFEPNSAVLKDSWKKNILDTAEMYKYAGVWDAVEGYHFDEPLGKISGEQFRVVTKFLAESFPDKRIYPVFSSMEVNGTHGCDAINYENCGYITDLGYDAYDSLDINFYREKFAQIQKQIGRKDVRLWVFPVSYQKTSAFDENHMLTHLNILYEVLKEFENPGGIHMYSFRPYGSTPAFQQLTDPELPYKYDKFLNRVVEIAKEVNQMEYTYKITKN